MSGYNRVSVSDGEYILKFENNIADRVTEWIPLVRCKDCKHADLFYPYCTIWEAAIDEDGYCYKGENE